MRSFFLCLPIILFAGFHPVIAADQHHHCYYDDATLRAVHFVDDREGWAVGDEGVIWHTMDGGTNWERQPSGVRGSLRSIHFVDTCVGWIAGREELPGGTSAGVVLFTRDAGVNWRRILVHSLPGLHLVRFVDKQTGYLAGDGSEQFPTGLFATTDGGKTWAPVPGPRAPSWRAGDFNQEGGALAGAWNRLATVRRGQVFVVDMDSLGGRSLCGLQLRGDGGVAVGQGGLVLLSRRSRGSSWYYAETGLPAEVRASMDFHAVSGTGKDIWAVGRPGSVALHSPDGGKSWKLVRTGQNMPLHGLFFSKERGWAVGELGTVLHTSDGGKTWRVVHRGGMHTAALCVHARPTGVPLDTASLLGARDGYLTTGLCVTGPEPVSADLGRVSEACRFASAYRQAGAAAAESLWQFPIGSHLARANKETLLAAWNQLHGDRAAEQLLRQVVLAIRTYRPAIVLTDHPASDHGADALVAEAVKEAFHQAGDATFFPEQLTNFGLEPHKAKKLYGLWPRGGADAQVHHDLTALSPRLGSSLREFSATPAALLSPDHPPAQRHYKLLADHLAGATTHRELMEGISLAPGGLARRLLPPLKEMSSDALKAVRARAHLWAIAEAPANELTSPERLLAQIGPTLAEMPEDAGARVVYGLANLYARKGQWAMARETHLMLVERYPVHPLAVQSYRWLILHQGSSEARRRHELGQFLVVEHVNNAVPGKAQAPINISPTPHSRDPKGQDAPTHPSTETKKKDPKAKPEVKHQVKDVPSFETKKEDRISYLGNKEGVRRWYQGCVETEKKLSAIGPLYSREPAIQFCVQSARRHLGDVEQALRWYREFSANTPDGPWRNCALAELWLSNRTGAPPKPVLTCRPSDTRPYLDGKLDDPCWVGARPVRLQSAAGDTLSRYPTEVRMAYDRDFVYFAVRCGHPAGGVVEAAKVRTRDQDLRRNDRVSILLDLDRDYATCFHLQVDQGGCVVEDCWGDRTWDPKWFVAIHREPAAWTAEIAIPRTALTGDYITPGNAWAANVIRVLPGQGVQALSLPAEAPETAIRPEGLGLILFLQGGQQAAARPDKIVPR
jgi:photosystem II stability/assembly factor-like uncharacterized protein